MTATLFSSLYLDSLVSEAAESPRRRKHRNIHNDYEDPCQRLFNAIEPDSYIRPHKHSVVPRAETLIAVRGMMALVLFNENGRVRGVYRFATDCHRKADAPAIGVEIEPDTWHTVVAIEPHSVLLELKAGPFDPSRPKELAPWAPAEGTDEGEQYLQWLRRVTLADAE